MLAEHEAEYEMGKRYLANMMGADPENFTQEEINVSTAILISRKFHLWLISSENNVVYTWLLRDTDIVFGIWQSLHCFVQHQLLTWSQSLTI